MLELSLHVLDILQNAIEAGASKIEITITEDVASDELVITVTDDGRGMDKEMIERVRDPFFTTRTTRAVGLGIPLLAANAELCNGRLIIESEPNKGTMVEATFQYAHIDRPPLGDMASTLLSVILSETKCNLSYQHRLGQKVFEFDTAEIRAELGGVPLSHPTVRRWLKDYIEEGLSELRS